MGRSEIETFGSTNMDDVLRSIPGVSTRDSTNPGVAVNIRGFEGSGRVNMMIDGVRQNFRFTGHEPAASFMSIRTCWRAWTSSVALSRPRARRRACRQRQFPHARRR
ncbi:MAG: TonB-dependent receptor plug domain-containing protein [Sphingomonadales bacterium]|nr:TonB-dependent receptor plug domain-containing protein [Sphingomonadales bacterium]